MLKILKKLQKYFNFPENLKLEIQKTDETMKAIDSQMESCVKDLEKNLLHTESLLKKIEKSFDLYKEEYLKEDAKKEEIKDKINESIDYLEDLWESINNSVSVGNALSNKNVNAELYSDSYFESVGKIKITNNKFKELNLDLMEIKAKMINFVEK